MQVEVIERWYPKSLTECCEPSNFVIPATISFASSER